MELNRLASREVTPAPRVLGREIGHAVKLCCGDGAEWRLNADHLVMSALALAVDAIVETEHAENVVVELPRQITGELHLEFGDVGGGLGIYFELGHGGLLSQGTGNLTRQVRNLPAQKANVDPMSQVSGPMSF